MPYLKSKDKELLNDFVFDGQGVLEELGEECQTAGELNFVITSIIQGYLAGNGVCYQNMNDVIGALEGAKLEFYRRIVSKYEEQKASENGDVMHETLKKEI